MVVALGLSQRRNNFTQHQQTFVDVDGFLGVNARRARQGLLL